MLIINSLCPSKQRLAFDILSKNQMDDLQKSIVDIVVPASEKRALGHTTLKYSNGVLQTVQQANETRTVRKVPLHADVYNQHQVQGKQIVNYIATVSLLERARFHFAAKGGETR